MSARIEARKELGRFRLDENIATNKTEMFTAEHRVGRDY